MRISDYFQLFIIFGTFIKQNEDFLGDVNFALTRDSNQRGRNFGRVRAFFGIGGRNREKGRQKHQQHGGEPFTSERKLRRSEIDSDEF